MSYAKSFPFGVLCSICWLTFGVWAFSFPTSSVPRWTRTAECVALLTRLERKLSVGAVLRMPLDEGPIFRICRAATTKE